MTFIKYVHDLLKIFHNEVPDGPGGHDGGWQKDVGPRLKKDTEIAKQIIFLERSNLARKLVGAGGVAKFLGGD